MELAEEEEVEVESLRETLVMELRMIASQTKFGMRLKLGEEVTMLYDKVLRIGVEQIWLDLNTHW